MLEPEGERQARNGQALAGWLGYSQLRQACLHGKPTCMPAKLPICPATAVARCAASSCQHCLPSPPASCTRPPAHPPAHLQDAACVVPHLSGPEQHAPAPHKLGALLHRKGHNERQVVGEGAVGEQVAPRGGHIEWVACGAGQGREGWGRRMAAAGEREDGQQQG